MKWIQPKSRLWRRAAIYMVVVLILLTVQFFLWPSVGALAQNWQEIRLQDEQLFRLREKASELEKKFSADQIFFDQLSAIAPHEQQTAQLIERLETVAQARQVTVQIQSINSDKGDKIKPVVFAIQVRGRPTALLSYVSALENLSELARIRSWNLDSLVPSSNQTTPVVRTYVLSMSILFYLQPSGLSNEAP